jgi:hypothetical protein
VDFIIPISDAERAQGDLNPSTARAVHVAMASHGVAILRGAFAIDTVDAMRHEFEAQFGGLDLAAIKALADQPPPTAVTEVGGARFEIVLRMRGAFGPAAFANPVIVNFLGRLLGPEMRLSGLTAVASYPGADAQNMHRDHSHLFPDRDVGPGLPVYAVNVSVPLIDVDEMTGPTALWPGSHRWPEGAAPPAQGAALVPFLRGDAILIDYRTGHAGIPNRGGRMRPILYMVYARPWFFDDVNHPGRSPLAMSLADYEALPENLKPLLARVRGQALRALFLAEMAAGA